MMRPPRGVWLFMILNASCVHRNMPVRFVFTTACHCSSVKSSSMMLPGVPIPALLKSTSRRPNFCVGDIGLHDERALARAGLLRGLVELVLAPPGERDAVAVLEEGEGDRASDAAPRARDDGDLS